MSQPPVALPPNELDALPAASIGTALTAAASLLWPELIAGATALAVLTGFVVWVRLLRSLRQSPDRGLSSRRFLPLLALTAGGWAGALAAGAAIPAIHALVLGTISLGLWGLVRHTDLGAGR